MPCATQVEKLFVVAIGYTVHQCNCIFLCLCVLHSRAVILMTTVAGCC